MKTIIHKAQSRGSADHGWLKTHYTFSFANYYNPERVHFGMLRVLNDDIIAPGMGFGTHPHDNMEIITIPLSGALEHKDSMGSSSVIKKGEVQVMSAGTGITHSEYNHSKTEEVKLLQTWVYPKEKNIQPRYDQRVFPPEERKNKFQLVVSPVKENSTMWINQDAYYSLGNFDKGMSSTYTIHHPGNGAYVFVIEGELEIDGQQLERRDGMGIWETDKFNLKALSNAEILIMEIPMN